MYSSGYTFVDNFACSRVLLCRGSEPYKDWYCQRVYNSVTVAGVPETNFNNRCHAMLVLSPARTAVVYALLNEPHGDNEQPCS